MYKHFFLNVEDFTETDMSPQMKFHQILNIPKTEEEKNTKTEMSLTLKLCQN